MTPTQKPTTPEEMQAAREAMRDSTAEIIAGSSRSRLWRYVLRRRDWLVWLLRKDASLPRRWWSL